MNQGDFRKYLPHQRQPTQIDPWQLPDISKVAKTGAEDATEAWINSGCFNLDLGLESHGSFPMLGRTKNAIQVREKKKCVPHFHSKTDPKYEVVVGSVECWWLIHWFLVVFVGIFPQQQHQRHQNLWGEKLGNVAPRPEIARPTVAGWNPAHQFTRSKNPTIS